MQDTSWLGWVLGTLAAVIFVFAVVRLTHYRLGRHEVEVWISRICVRRIEFRDIDDAIVGFRFPGLLWPSTFVPNGRCLSIRCRGGLFPYTIITPRNPARFRADIYYALGRNPESDS